MMMKLPPEVIAVFEERGGREWLMKELGFDFGPPPKNPKSQSKQVRINGRAGWSILNAAMR